MITERNIVILGSLLEFIIFVVLYFRHKGKVNFKKRIIIRNKGFEYLDLKSNNDSTNYSLEYGTSLLLTILICVGGYYLSLAGSLMYFDNYEFIKQNDYYIKAIYFLALSFMFYRHYKFYSVVEKMHNKFNNEDVIWDDNSLRISPFLIRETNPLLKKSFKSFSQKVEHIESLNYIKILWDDFKTIEVKEVEVKRSYNNGSRGIYHIYELRLKNRTKFTIDRKPFFGAEKDFLNIIENNSDCMIKKFDSLKDDRVIKKNVLLFQVLASLVVSFVVYMVLGE